MLPKHLRNRLPKIRGPNVNTLGYRHMCRFFSMIWFVALRKYELAMRVDEDVCIHTLHHMPDPFAALRLNNAVYGYSAQTAEKHLPTTRSMQGWARSYMVEHAITPASRPVDVRRIYFTNFFLSSTSWWTEPRVSAFLDAVDRNGSTYTYRWGDAPIQSTALDLFAKREQLLFVPVDYTHISTNNEISYGIEVRFDRNEHEPSPQKKFMKAFESCFAPCAVANARQLQGFPFRTLSGSIRGLRRARSRPRSRSPISCASTWRRSCRRLCSTTSLVRMGRCRPTTSRASRASASTRRSSSRLPAPARRHAPTRSFRRCRRGCARIRGCGGRCFATRAARDAGGRAPTPRRRSGKR